VRRPRNLESTARGIALLAGMQCGLIPDLSAIAAHRQDDVQRFEPQINTERRRHMRDRWNDAVNRSLGWHG